MLYGTDEGILYTTCFKYLYNLTYANNFNSLFPCISDLAAVELIGIARAHPDQIVNWIA